MANDAHDLMPDLIIPLIPRLYATEHIPDPLALIKLFTPWTNWSWFIAEFSSDEQLCFGLVAGHEEELGYFSLDELKTIRGPGGLQIERDLYFVPCPLSHCRRSFRDLPVIDCCDNCGACCMEQGSPPGYVMLLNIAELGDDAEVWREDFERVQVLPPEALRTLRDYKVGLLSGLIDGDGPCVWLDLTTKQCRFYDHRPSICRNLERGSASCRSWRESYDIEPTSTMET